MEQVSKKGKKASSPHTLLHFWGRADRNDVGLPAGTGDVGKHNLSASQKEISKCHPRIQSEHKNKFQVEILKEKVVEKNPDVLYPSLDEGSEPAFTSLSTLPSKCIKDQVTYVLPGQTDDNKDQVTYVLPGQTDDNKDQVTSVLPGQTGDNKDQVTSVLPGQTDDNIDQVTFMLPGQTDDNKDQVTSVLPGQTDDNKDQLKFVLPGQTDDNIKVRNSIPDVFECRNKKVNENTQSIKNSTTTRDINCAYKDTALSVRASPTVDQLEFEEAMSLLEIESYDGFDPILSQTQDMSASCAHENDKSVSENEENSAEEEPSKVLKLILQDPCECPPEPKQLMSGKCITPGSYPLICFDLETTGLSIDDEIVQISACGIISGKREEFNQYILPNKRMAFGASKVTGIRIRRGCLYHNRAKVQTCSILQALNKFLHWLKLFPKSVLVAHNAMFDSRLLIKSCVQHNLVQFGLKKAVFGFIDTLPAMKEMFPGRKSYKLESLVKDVLRVNFKAHDAREDTRVLLNLVLEKSVDRSVLFKHSFTIECAEENYRVLAEKKKNMKSLNELVDASVLSKGMAEKMASCGLTKKDLSLAVEENGLDGLREIFQADENGKPRITNRTAIMQNLFDHLTIQDA